MYIENKTINKYITSWLLLMLSIVAVIIIVGGLTRLTDSGLSITKWELFTGIFPPFNDSQWEDYFDLYKEIPEFKLQNYSMTLNEFKVIFWWEYVHRLLGRLLGVLFFLPLVFFSFKIGFNKTKGLFFIFILICIQGFIGWYMVSSGLINRIDVSHYRLAVHLVLAFIILSLIFWNYLFYKQIIVPTRKLHNGLLIMFMMLLFFQIAVGALVSGMDGAKIYNTWPLMGSSYFPDDNSINNLFTLSVFNDPSLTQFIHRNLAYVIFFVYLFILFKVYYSKLIGFFKIIFLIGFILLLQIILGIFVLLSGANIIISSLHQISSIFLFSSSIYLLYLNINSNLQLSD